MRNEIIETTSWDLFLLQLLKLSIDQQGKILYDYVSFLGREGTLLSGKNLVEAAVNVASITGI